MDFHFEWHSATKNVCTIINDNADVRYDAKLVRLSLDTKLRSPFGQLGLQASHDAGVHLTYA